MGFPNCCLLKEHCNTHGLFEQSGEMPVFESPETWEAGEGGCGCSGCISGPFFLICLCWQRISLSVPSHCVSAPHAKEVVSYDEHTRTSCVWIQSRLCSNSLCPPANAFMCLSFSSCNEWQPKNRHKNDAAVPKSSLTHFCTYPWAHCPAWESPAHPSLGILSFSIESCWTSEAFTQLSGCR